MQLFLWNLLLALVWAIAVGRFTLANLLVGFVLGYLMLWFARQVIGPTTYFRRVARVIAFAWFYARELVEANLRVAYDVVTPRLHMRPAVIAIPLDAKTDAEITLLANLITLTPGSLSLDVSPDRKYLYIHFMYVEGDDLDKVRRRIKDGLERRVLELLR